MKEAKARRRAPLDTPTDLGANAVRDISATLNTLLALGVVKKSAGTPDRAYGR